jgi:hypothetical protein
MKKIAVFTGLALFVAGAAVAQEVPRIAVSGGAGFTTGVGDAGERLDTGWNIRGGVGVNFSPHVGVMLDLGYDSMGIKSSELNNLGYGGGNLNVFSATVNPIVHLAPRSKADFYLTGGGGYYRMSQDFTQPGVVTGTGFDPFFGFYPVAVGTNVVVSSYSVNKPGWDIGGGVAFGSKWHGKFFAEARYNRIYIGNYYTEYIPVTFGFRR